MTERKIRAKKAILISVIVVSVLIAYFFFVRFTGLRIPCMFHVVTHLNCPGCGSTRAVMAYARLDFKEGLSYNYMFPLGAAYMLWFAADSVYCYIKYGGSSEKHDNKLMFIHVPMLIIMVIWFVVRNVLHV